MLIIDMRKMLAIDLKQNYCLHPWECYTLISKRLTKLSLREGVLMDIGLRVEYDGKKNVVLAGEIIKEYPIGGLMCEYARLRPTELKEVILRNPLWNEKSLSKKGGDALYAFYNDMVEKFDVVIAGIVIADFSSFLRDYLQAERKDLIELIGRLNCDKDKDSIKQFILKDTGFQEFGISTIGQAF